MKITETNDTIQISIHFDLKDSFRGMFKTAKWNPTCKTWDIKNTTANKNKLEQFRASLDSSGAEQAIEDSDNQEATSTELAALTEQLATLTQTRTSLMKAKGSAEALASQLANLKAHVATELAQVQAEKQAQEAIHASNTAALAEILAGYTYEGKSVQQVIALAGRALYGGHKYKADFHTYQAWLAKTDTAIQKTFKVTFQVLNECANANFNRADRDGKWFREDIFATRFITIVEGVSA